jgi:Tol biopolymer transport system component
VIHVADPDGSNERVLFPGGAQCPQVSPDGTRVAFAFVEGGGVAIGTIRIDGTDRRTLSAPPDGLQLGCATWSSDGRRLAAEGWHETDSSHNGIYLIDATDGRNVERLTSSPGGGHDLPGDFSPDGRYLSFVRAPFVGGTSGRLHTVELATGAEREVTPRMVDAGPTWSPDGRTIVIDDPISPLFLVIDVESGTIGNLGLPIPVGSVGFPQYSPDGTRLLFHAAEGGFADIYTMAIDGTDLVQVTDTPNLDEDFTDWGIALD